MAGPDGAEVWDAADRSGLEAKAKFILITLAGLAGLLSSVTMSERELAEETGFSRSLVWDRLHVLEEVGWLRAHRRPGYKTVFTLLIPGGAR